MVRLFFFIFLIPAFSWALEVDEKLTVRVIKISGSRKTVMINRGAEDGLVEGDHAKFVVTAGIVARGVLVKVSPTRSVWSMYRLVNADFVVTDSVMTLKITPPVKITKDESQALVREDVPSTNTADPTTLGIPLAEGAEDIKPEDEKLSSADLRALEDDSVPASIVDRNLELLGFIHISGLTANTKASEGDSINSSQSYHNIGLGAEWYPRREREWYSAFSLQAGFSLMLENSQSFGGQSVANQTNEFGLGLNWHPFSLPSSVNTFIPYLHTSLGIGSVKSTIDPGVGDSFTNDGSTSSFSFGIGFKYYTHRGWGFRALLDYYLRSEKYGELDDGNITWDKRVGGPRFFLGMSYRF